MKIELDWRYEVPGLLAAYHEAISAVDASRQTRQTPKDRIDGASFQ
jgi:hypothetical protein